MYRFVPLFGRFWNCRIMDPLVVILGATGTGKSKLAIELATKFKGEIISADSMQIYQGLDILTNKVTAEEQSGIKHHMLNFVNPLETYTVVEFRDTVLPIISRLNRGKTLPIVVGGTHYYVESILWKVLVQSCGNFDKFSREVSQINRISSSDLGENCSDVCDKESSVFNMSPNMLEESNCETTNIEKGQSGCLKSSVKPNEQYEQKINCETHVKDSLKCYKSVSSDTVISDNIVYPASEQQKFIDATCNQPNPVSINISTTSNSITNKFVQNKAVPNEDLKNESEANEINIQQLNYSTISNDEIIRMLEKVDPEMSSRYHPNDRRKIIRSLEVWHQTGIRHSEHIRRQSEEVGGADLGGRIRFRDAFVLWITCEKDNLNKRLDGRVDEMVRNGLLQELSAFHTSCNFPVMQKSASEDFSNEKAIDHYQKGIFQSIGLKEFHEYLLLDEDSRISDVGNKLFQKGLETMKLRTRQYAKRQEKWMRNRFLIRNREKIPVYALDGNDLSKWNENVLNPAVEIVQSLLKGKAPSAQPTTLSSNEVADTGDKTRHFCDICQRIFIGNPQWEQHMKSKKHQAMVTKRNKAGHDANGVTKRLVDNDDVQLSKVQKT